MRLSLERGSITNRIAYFFSIVISMLAAFALRFDFAIPSDEVVHLEKGILAAVVLKIVTFHFERLHRT